jgi:homoserine dehydrogenase
MNIVLSGFGAVGQAAARVLMNKEKEWKRTYGVHIKITAVLDRSGVAVHSDGLDPEQLLQTKAETGRVDDGSLPPRNVDQLWADSQADIFIDAAETNTLTGGSGLALMQSALRHGVDVVCVSKGALAFAWDDLHELAEASGRKIKYSGAAAAALPTVDTALYSLAGSEIHTIEGLLNGTSNMIATRVAAEHITLQEAWETAKKEGKAEADPSEDIGGKDTALKMYFLTKACLTPEINWESVTIRGLDELSDAEWKQAEHGKTKWKLVGKAHKMAQGTVVSVEPRLLTAEHPFFHVDGAEKAVLFSTDTMGSVLVSGGASSPTGAAAAAWKDVIHLASERA